MIADGYDEGLIYDCALGADVVTRTFSLPQELLDLVDEIVDVIPQYKSRSHFIRDALMHGLVRLEKVKDQDFGSGFWKEEME